MPITYTALITLAVTLASWSEPQPQWSQGNVGLYGSWRLVQANAEYRGYDLDGYRCGGSLMSPSSLGKTFWVRLPSSEWYGPCLSVDCSARIDYYNNTVSRREVAEVDRGTMEALGAPWKKWTDVYLGTCPPMPYRELRGEMFWPSIQFDVFDPGARFSYASSFWPFPKQETSHDCNQ